MKLFRKETVWTKAITRPEAEALGTGRVLHADAGGRSLCVARTEKGFFVMDDRCPHNGFALSKGWCSDDHAVVCPLHRYRFDLDTGRAKSGIADAVRTYPAEMREDGLYFRTEVTRLNL